MTYIPEFADGVKDSSGNPAGNVVLRDKATAQTEHNRYLELGASGSTWPGDDTFSMTWDVADAITYVRLHVTGGADGNYVKFCKDAVNEAQAESWLGDPSSSSTADVNHRRCYTSTPDGNGTFIPLYEEIFIPEGYALTRLDFLGSAVSLSIFAEAI